MKILGMVAGTALVVFLALAPLWIIEHLFKSSGAWPLWLLLALAVILILGMDWFMHGYRFVWIGDRRYTWLLSGIAMGGFLHRLTADGWGWFVGMVPFILLMWKDHRRYSGVKKNTPA